MKKYIILTFNFSGMGGAELYVRDKQEYMTSLGWKTYVFSNGSKTGEKDVLIDDLKQYHNGITYRLNYYPHFYKKRDVLITLEWMKKQIEYNEADEIIIESHTEKTACWGELLAKHCRGKHICFILNEIFRGDCVEFMDFKHRRRELAGTYDDSLVKMFDGFKSVSENERTYLIATNSQVVKDIRFDKLPNREDYDWIIASIGRLEKAFVPSMLNDISVFARRHSEKRILLLLMASDEKQEVKKCISDTFSTIPNIEVIATGVLSPIPKVIFSIVDVFVSSATSAQISACEGVPTITVDGNDYKGIGVLGYTTSEDLYHSSEDDIHETYDLLEEVLVNGLCKKIPFNPELVWLFKQRDWMGILKTHIEFINNSESNIEYYDVFKSKPTKGIGYKQFLLKFLGASLTERVFLFLRQTK